MLAPELTDDVIDHLRCDKRALAACTLVCKSWTARSTYHLFFEVSVNRWSFKRILSLSQPSNRTAGSVRMLTILLLNHEQMQRLNPLRLEPFSAVTVLAFFKVIFPSMDEFAELLCCFPRLHILSINMSFWFRDNCEGRFFKTRGCPPVGLHTLNVGLHMSSTRMMGFSWLFQWFLEKGMPPLSTVRLHGFPNEEVACIAEALQKLRNSLQFLELELDIGESVEDEPLEIGGIDLGHHHNLRSLTILEGHPTALYRLLNTMTSPSVLEETKLSVNSEAILSAINCSDLDRLLSSTGFRTIHLDIEIMYREEDSRIQVEKVESFFPMCSARGKLQITAESIALDGQLKGFITSRWRDPALAAAGRRSFDHRVI